MWNKARWQYGLIAVLGGFFVLLVAYALAVSKYEKAGDVSTAMAAITGAIGSLAGAYFGVQVGSEGKAQADHRAEAMSLYAMRFAAIADPARASEVLPPLRDGYPLDP
jgi:hypothetical protein